MTLHTPWYVSYIVAKYFTSERHPEQAYRDYAALYDNPFSRHIPQHLELVEDIGRYYNNMEHLSKPLFQDDFDLFTSQLHRLAIQNTSFDQSHHRQALVTPPAPAPLVSPVFVPIGQRSPIVEPMTSIGHHG
jgi:hypothetical protein